MIDFNEIRILSERVELSRRVHDELAEVVLNIFEMETNLRLNFPELFWGAAGFNFRTHVWEEWVKEEGLPSGDSLELLLSGLFAPNQDFVYPLPWAWEEQEVGFIPDLVMDDFEDEVDTEPVQYIPKGIPWAKVVELWKPVFAALAEQGSFTFTADAFSAEELTGWANTPDAVDLWVQFFHTDILMQEQAPEGGSGVSDECQQLIQYVLAEDLLLESLRGKTLRTSIAPEPASGVRCSGLDMSPYMIMIVER